MKNKHPADMALHCATIWFAIGLYHYAMGTTDTVEGLIRMLVGISGVGVGAIFFCISYLAEK